MCSSGSVAEPPPILDTAWSLEGEPAIILENRRLRAVVLPGIGGKMISLIDQFADRARAGVELAVRTPVSGSRATKRLTLGTGPSLRVDYQVTNGGRTDLPFLWKSHLAVRLHPDTRTELEATTVVVHDFGAPRTRPADAEFVWPVAVVDGTSYDFSELPDTADRGVSELLMATELTDGRCGVVHPGAGSGLLLTWDRAALPSCWLFGSYGGGWRGRDVLVLEPCTGYPASVTEGVAAGTHQVLAAGAGRSWSLTATVGAG